MLEMIRALIAKARYYTEAVAFSALDATRAESASCGRCWPPPWRPGPAR